MSFIKNISIGGTLFLFASIAAADKYGLYDPADKSPSPPIWFYIYFIAGLWLGLGKNSPLKDVANKYPWTSIILFLFVIPLVLVFMLGW